MFVFYLSIFISYYPAVFTYDMNKQTKEAFSMLPLSNFHPVLHTLFLKMCYSIGDILGDKVIGLSIYSIFQIARAYGSDNGVISEKDKEIS